MSPRGASLSRLASLLAALLLTGLLAGCSGNDQTNRDETTVSGGESTQRERTGGISEPAAPESPEYGYTHTSPSGDRAFDGAADLPNSEPLDVELSGEPAWVAGVPTEDETAWVAVLEDGRAEAFRVGGDGEARPANITPQRLPPGAPPLLRYDGEDLELVSGGDDASDLTHPVPLAQSEGLLIIGEDGELSVESGGETQAVPDAPEALPDARAVRSSSGEIALLTDPTDRYEHAVLGDGVEADTLTVLRPTSDGLRVRQSFEAESGGVFEEISPMWLERDGEELLAVTESVPGRGTRVSVYTPGGELAAAGPFIGEGMKWRHLTAAAPFGEEVGLSATLTPHIGGVAEFYEFTGEDELEITARASGYATHRLGSRNLDTALAGDLDGGGGTELLAPEPSYTTLNGIGKTPDGARAEWSVPAGGEISTNLAAATGSDGDAVIAAGRADEVLRIWR